MHGNDDIIKRFIEPEELPVQYGGLKREQDDDFTPEDKVSELIVRGNTTNYIKIPVAEVLLSLINRVFN